MIEPLKKRANLRDVAKSAGVSVATVSRVLNAPEVVSQATRDRVLKAIEHLHFVPSAAARAINSGRTRMVGALVPTLDNAIFARFLAVLEERLGTHGLSLVVATTQGDEAIEEQKAAQLLGIGAEALIISGITHSAGFDDLVRRTRLPVVATSYFDADYHLPTIGYDNVEAASLALRFLYDAGHRDIGVLHGPPETNDRTRARLKGLQGGPGDMRMRLFKTDLSMEGAVLGTRDFLAADTPATALLCLSDVLATSALFELQRQGVDVPGRLSLIGIDNLPFSTFAIPPITSVHLPVGRMGEQAADAVALWIEEQTVPQPIRLETSLIKRGSTRAVETG